MEFSPLAHLIPSYRLIRDPQQMVWVLKRNRLIAVPFGSSVKPGTCTATDFYCNGKGTPYYLGIKEQTLCLCYTEFQGQPTLQLKEENIMNLCGNFKGQEPFLFYCSEEGSTFVFQSVSCPGWFIATSSMVEQPVTLTKEGGKTKNTNFYLEGEN
ncbi:interleukin-36 beta-like [Physeter macrocephalus]|uniref:Interleukin-1 n=1 Tax=Physeter macrocephalus TaxID=9755 RepID=A0A2Y9T7I7_PHYMC|nr:interleukin-36 beta-like [Physeter catodon]|eukprot:XP_023985577.1 interleukin-36 beta-like [Physeter catodon]